MLRLCQRCSACIDADAQKKQWVVEDEKVNLMVDASSADVKLQQTISLGS